MEAKELRLGNWIYISEKGEYQIDHPHDLEELWDRDFEDCCGIVLTEEWLLKFGFELHPKNNFHIDLYVIKIKPDTENQLIISIGFKDKSWNMFNGINDAWCNTLNINKIKYVHQLQNLFFALTGEELQTPVVKVE